MRYATTLLLLLAAQLATAGDQATIRMPSQDGTFTVEISKSDNGKYSVKVLENGEQNFDLLSEPDTDAPPAAAEEPKLDAALVTPDIGPDRVIIFVSDSCPPCVTAKPKLYAAFGDLSKVTEPRPWRMGDSDYNDFQVVDVDRNPELADTISLLRGGEMELPLLIKVEGGAIVREFKVGCTTPLDQWSLGWLYSGVNSRPGLTPAEVATVPTSGHYPLRGGWWSVSGNWHPTKGVLVNHLAGASQHRGKFHRDWLNSLTAAELNSLHSDDHEGRLKRQYVNTSSEAPTETAVAPAQPLKAPAVRRAAPTRRYCPTCPTGRSRS